MLRQCALPAALLAGVLLSGCNTAPKTLYQWGGYQQQVYKHFQGQAPETQIAALEESFQKIRANGAMPPPGYHAHLGMLYSEIGKGDQAVQQFNTEKALFPESVAYMDFLLKNYKQ
ncbi:DUF4810 domain-containing protein [Jeongeupia naejangsanensis]|uniref:DUF4810 domain-containing protein n=1 Tax=Jeongeupia naejangsanensis TaxID=613195 RepID=A0ABS2BGY9_9NEIS|nr:DUF4810 domain-containing protein [Jeongeupia naejangsanensis]MBM3114879.1 DUF4810 domain-containing protein [Jeongeupia naejangsanensis]